MYPLRRVQLSLYPRMAIVADISARRVGYSF